VLDSEDLTKSRAAGIKLLSQKIEEIKKKEWVRDDSQVEIV
jgi:hypothetical protein